MSADRDRGIRRVKQKRAKDQKKTQRELRSQAVANRSLSSPKSVKPAAA